MYVRLSPACFLKGKVIAWFQGAMAFGPRSMGSRSILCDPSGRYARNNMNEYLRQTPLDEPLPLVFAPSAINACLTPSAASSFSAIDAAVDPKCRESLAAALDAQHRARVHTVSAAQAHAALRTAGSALQGLRRTCAHRNEPGRARTGRVHAPRRHPNRLLLRNRRARHGPIPSHEGPLAVEVQCRLIPMDFANPAAASGQVTVSIATEADREAWERYVAQGSADVQSSQFKVGAVSGYHEWPWRQVFTQTFGHECIYLAARINGRGQIYGILPLVLIKSLLFGRTLTSLPFVNYGGVVADSEPVARALLDAAADVAKSRNAKHVELRHTDRVFEDLPLQAAQGVDAPAAPDRHVGGHRPEGAQPDPQG